jgi:hypothetical protein
MRLMQAGTVAIISYNEVESRNINPRTNEPYMNRYYEGAVAPAPEPELTIPSVPTSRGGDPDLAWRIALSVGAKLAVQTMPMMAVEQRDFDTQKKIALAWATWLVSTPAASAPGAYDEPPFAEDDIPYLCLDAPAPPFALTATAGIA